MNHDFRRRFGVHAAVICIGAAGVSLLILGPLTGDLFQSERELDANVARALGVAHRRAELPAWEQRAEEAEAAERGIAAAGALALDPVALHAFADEIARRHGVSILGVGPGPGEPAPADNLVPSRLVIDARGGYEDITRFVEDFATRSGLTRIDAVRVTPAPEPGSSEVVARLQTSHIGVRESGGVKPGTAGRRGAAR